MRLIQLSVLLGILTLSYGYKYLGFFPFPGRSHNKLWDPLLKVLALRGHQVTAVKAFKMENPPTKNYKEIIVKDVLPDLIKMMGGNHDSFLRPSFIERQIMAFTFKTSGPAIGEMWMKDPGIQQIMNSNDTYDAVLFESTTMQDFFTALQHKFNAVGIEVLTVGNIHWSYWMLGNPIDSSYIVEMPLEYSDRMTFLQRLHNTVNSGVYRLLWYWIYLDQYQTFMDKHIRYPGWETRPPLSEMISNTNLVLIGTDVALSYPHPMAPHFVQIGGINILPNKPLPKDIQEFMDGAEYGVIYFTMGSHIKVSSVLGSSLRDKFASAFSKLKQRVLWKWETEDFPNPPPNVLIKKWFPQQDILAHKNIKLFITHGGFLSMTESIHYGVPMIGIPIFADQDKNMNFVQNRGIGIHLPFEDLTEESIYRAIDQVISNPKYLKNAQRQSTLLRDKPKTPLENAVFWSEYVVRHKGAEHLRPASATMPWYQHALIDVYIVLVLIVLTPVYMIYKFFSCICHRCFRRKVTKNKKE